MICPGDPFGGPYQVKLWTSSHGTGKHHLPKYLKYLYEDNPYFLLPEINAKPGRYLDDVFMSDFSKDFEILLEETTPRINVILMGDNDIRAFNYRGGYQIVKNTWQLLKMHGKTMNPLILMGLMPSPLTHHQSLPLAEYTDDRLREQILIQRVNVWEKPHLCSFVSTASFFSDSKGRLENKKYFHKDLVHLNRVGAFALAYYLLDYLDEFAEGCIHYEREKAIHGLSALTIPLGPRVPLAIKGTPKETSL